MKDLKFVLFHPVSISISDKYFKYRINNGMFYPCLLGVINKDNKCIDVISGRKFDIISEEDYRRSYTLIDNNLKVVGNQVYVCKKINNSLENLKFIEKYISAKGYVSIKKMQKHLDFSYRLNHLLSIRKEDDAAGFHYPLFIIESPKSYLQKIDIENLKSLAKFLYIQSKKKIRMILQKQIKLFQD